MPTSFSMECSNSEKPKFMVELTSAVLTGSETFRCNHVAQKARVETLRGRIAVATAGGRADMVERHRSRGKLLVRERIDLLVDPGTAFMELSSLAAYGQYGGDVPGAGIDRKGTRRNPSH